MENETSSMFIAKLGLEPHPEGGFYKQIYKSSENLKTKNRAGMRASATN